MDTLGFIKDRVGVLKDFTPDRLKQWSTARACIRSKRKRRLCIAAPKPRISASC